MHSLDFELPPAERIILAVDTSDEARAMELMQTAKQAGGWIVKLGLELSSATSWRACSEMAADAGLDWVADAKLKDIPNTVAGAVRNISGLDHPPVGITIHTKSGIKALEAAQEIASERDITMLGVTHLTSIDEKETKEYEKDTSRVVVWRESRRAVAANIGGLVCSPMEVGMVKRFRKTNGLFTMIPGTRSAGADIADQKRSGTPYQAILDGADLLVIGRQVSGADDPAEAFQAVTQEITSAVEARAA